MILVGMEESGVLRRALRARGLEAWSCDLQPSADDSTYHIQDDIRKVMRSPKWKRGLFHPVCKYLANSGIKHLYKNHGKTPLIRDEERWEKMVLAAEFMLSILNLDYSVVCENPWMHKYGEYIVGRSFCITQPYFHGDKATKRTDFWRNDMSFSPLKHTNVLTLPPAGSEERKKWEGTWRATPGPSRERDRSRSFPGLMKAVAEQWF